jgi:hypothetical protein
VFASYQGEVKLAVNSAPDFNLPPSCARLVGLHYVAPNSFLKTTPIFLNKPAESIQFFFGFSTFLMKIK